MAVPPQRLRLIQLRLELAQVRRQYGDVLAAMVLAEEQQARRARQQRRWWVKPWLLNRALLGQYDTLMVELMRHCHGDFKSYMRMQPDMFREICQRVGPRVAKNLT